jgi:hypothetical protein
MFANAANRSIRAMPRARGGHRRGRYVAKSLAAARGYMSNMQALLKYCVGRHRNAIRD